MLSKAMGIWLVLFWGLSMAFSAPADPRDVFFTTHPIPHLRIQLDDEAMAGLRVNYRSYVKATVTEGGTTYRNVGIHLKGQYGTFKGIDGKPSLTLNFDKFQKGQSFHGLDKFHLNNSAQDPSYLCEIVGRELFQEAGLPTARASHARVELNGRDLGLFVLVEGTDKSFLRRHFKNPDGNLYDSGFRHDIADAIEKKSGNGPDNHSDLHALLAAAGEADHTIRLQRLSALLDLNQFYTLLALESVIRHHDGYSMGINNYRIYFEPTSQKATFMPHGMDQLFFQPQAHLLSELKGTLATAVLQTQAGRKEFRSLAATFYTNLFPSLSNRVETAHMRIRPVLLQSDTNSGMRHDHAITNLHARIHKRSQHLEAEVSDIWVARPTFQSTNTVFLTNWVASSGSSGTVMFQTNQNQRMSLVITAARTGGSFSGMWQSRVLLPVGTYIISTHVKAAGPVFRGPQNPVSLKLFGRDDLQMETIRRDSQTVELRSSFEVFSRAEESLIECHASGSRSAESFSFDSFSLLKAR